MSGDPFALDHPNCQVPYACAVGASEPVGKPPGLNSPLIALDYPRQGNRWVNRGTMGSAGDAVGPGGAGDPAQLGGFPGYLFTGVADRFTQATRLFVGNVGSFDNWSLLVWLSSVDNSQTFHYPIGFASAQGLGYGGTGIGQKWWWVDGATTLDGGAITLNERVFLAVTKEGTTYSLYRGRSSGFALENSGVKNNTNPTAMYIGQRDVVFPASFSGGVYALRFYPCLLSADALRYYFQRQRHVFSI